MAEGPRDGGEGAGLRQYRGRALTAGKARGGGCDRRASRAEPGTVEGGGAGEGTRRGGWGGGRGQWDRQKRQDAGRSSGQRAKIQERAGRQEDNTDAAKADGAVGRGGAGDHRGAKREELGQQAP